MKKSLFLGIVLLSLFPINARAFEDCMKFGFDLGKCQVRYKNGDYYYGQYRWGKPRGQGKLYYRNGSSYSGEWRKGKPHGQGTYSAPKKYKSSGDQYVGEWRKGKFHGHGKETFANGEEYTGKYRDGKRHGKGILKRANGERRTLEYRDGKLISDELDSGGNRDHWNSPRALHRRLTLAMLPSPAALAKMTRFTSRSARVARSTVLLQIDL